MSERSKLDRAMDDVDRAMSRYTASVAKLEVAANRYAAARDARIKAQESYRAKYGRSYP